MVQWQYRNMTELGLSSDHIAWLVGGWLQSGSAESWKLEVTVSFNFFSKPVLFLAIQHTNLLA
jgi:hypothetical protein